MVLRRLSGLSKIIIFAFTLTPSLAFLYYMGMLSIFYGWQHFFLLGLPFIILSLLIFIPLSEIVLSVTYIVLFVLGIVIFGMGEEGWAIWPYLLICILATVEIWILFIIEKIFRKEEAITNN